MRCNRRHPFPAAPLIPLETGNRKLETRLSHAHLLRPLSWKDERDHRGPFAASAISCANVGTNWLSANRWAIASALRTMVDDTRGKPFESWNDRIAKGTNKVPGGLHD